MLSSRTGILRTTTDATFFLTTSTLKQSYEDARKRAEHAIDKLKAAAFESDDADAQEKLGGVTHAIVGAAFDRAKAADYIARVFEMLRMSDDEIVKYDEDKWSHELAFKSKASTDALVSALHALEDAVEDIE